MLDVPNMFNLQLAEVGCTALLVLAMSVDVNVEDLVVCWLTIQRVLTVVAPVTETDKRLKDSP